MPLSDSFNSAFPSGNDNSFNAAIPPASSKSAGSSGDSSSKSPPQRGASLKPLSPSVRPMSQTQESDETEDDDDGPSIFAPRVSRTDIIYFTGQLAVMVDTGISLSTALQGMISEEKNVTLKKILIDINRTIEGGGDFSGALVAYPHLFDKTYLALIKAGEASGTLSANLDRLSLYMRKGVETRGKVRAAMAYPALMFVLALGVTIFLLTYIMPKFTPIFMRKGMKLPTPTVIMMFLADALTHYKYLWIAAAIGAVAGYFYLRGTEKGRQGLDWLKINFPLVGQMFRKTILSRCIRTLGALVNSGVSMLEALKLTKEVSDNYYYEKTWARVIDQVISGNQICTSLSNNPLFPSSLVQMISAGEQTGKLGPVLERVSNYYDQEVESSIKMVTSLLEPLMITVMGVVVGGIAMALLLPIFTLSRAVG